MSRIIKLYILGLTLLISSCFNKRIAGTYIFSSFQTEDTLSFTGSRYQLRTGSHFYKGFSTGIFKVYGKKISFEPDSSFLLKAWIIDSLHKQKQKSETKLVIDDFEKYKEDFDLYIEDSRGEHKLDSGEYILPASTRRFHLVARLIDYMGYSPPYFNKEVKSGAIDLTDLGGYFSELRIKTNLARRLFLFIKLEDYIIGRDGIRPSSARLYEKK